MLQNAQAMLYTLPVLLGGQGQDRRLRAAEPAAAAPSGSSSKGSSSSSTAAAPRSGRIPGQATINWRDSFPAGRRSGDGTGGLPGRHWHHDRARADRLRRPGDRRSRRPGSCSRSATSSTSRAASRSSRAPRSPSTSRPTRRSRRPRRSAAIPIGAAAATARRRLPLAERIDAVQRPGRDDPDRHPRRLPVHRLQPERERRARSTSARTASSPRTSSRTTRSASWPATSTSAWCCPRSSPRWQLRALGLLPRFTTIKAFVGQVAVVGLEDFLTLELNGVRLEVNTGGQWAGAPSPVASGDPLVGSSTAATGYAVSTGEGNPPVVLDMEGYLIGGGADLFVLGIGEFVHLRGAAYFEMGAVATVPLSSVIDLERVRRCDSAGRCRGGRADREGAPVPQLRRRGRVRVPRRRRAAAGSPRIRTT